MKKNLIKLISENMIYFIEGNIGSGKTTILKSLKIDDCSIFTEPVTKWIPLLNDVYSTNKGHFKLQKTITTDMYNLFTLNYYSTLSKDLIFERSVFTSYYCFVECYKHLFTLDQLNELTKIKNDFIDFLTDNKIKFKIIYIDTDYKICNKRIKKRSMDNKIGIDLLKNLEICHKNFINRYKHLIDFKIINNDKNN